MNIAVVLAAGKGVRMKSKINKIFLPLGKNEVIYYCLRTFQRHKNIDKIIIVTAKENIEKMQKIAQKNHFNKVSAIIEGGKERQFSARNGLKFIKDNFANCNIVLFHNAGNPFAAPQEIDELIIAANKYGAAAVGIPVRDTIKETDKKQIVIKTIPRRNLWAMQTPQAIKFPLALKAFNKAEEEKFLGTDDVSLVERLGKKVKIIQCSEKNFKITTRNDLKKARDYFNF